MMAATFAEAGEHNTALEIMGEQMGSKPIGRGSIPRRPAKVRLFMKQAHGIFQFVLSAFEKGLWWDSDEEVKVEKKDKDLPMKGWGIKLALMVGKLVRPVGKIYKKEFWWGGKGQYNPWKCPKENIWFTLRIPFVIMPFISVALGKYGFYAGAKPFRVAPHNEERYKNWVKKEEVGTEENPNNYLAPSFSARKSRMW